MYQLTHSIFLAGTDTGVGKTHVGCQLLRQAHANGQQVAAWKPVAAGCELYRGQWQNDDALALQNAAGNWQSYSEVNPLALPLAASPHIAAEQAGRPIEIEELAEKFRLLQQRCSLVLVEGAGGWLAPVSATQTMADLAIALQLPVILVVAIRLGCLNHAQLTAKAILDSGLPLQGWIANCIEPDMAQAQENIDWLEQQLPCPMVQLLERETK